MNEIIRDPGRFGLTGDTVKIAYGDCGEKTGTEGRTRENLIRLAVQHEWTRVRHYIRPVDYWSIQFDEWDSVREAVTAFVSRMVDTGIMSAHDTVQLASLTTACRFAATAAELTATGYGGSVRLQG